MFCDLLSEEFEQLFENQLKILDVHENNPLSGIEFSIWTKRLFLFLNSEIFQVCCNLQAVPFSHNVETLQSV